MLEAFDVSTMKDEDQEIEFDVGHGASPAHRDLRKVPTLKGSPEGDDETGPSGSSVTSDIDSSLLFDPKISFPSPRSLSSMEVQLLKWNFLSADINPCMMCLKEGTLLCWDTKEEWAFAKSTVPILNGCSFFEICKVGGVSQLLQVGIACADVDCSSATGIKQSQFGRTRFCGTWLLCKVKPPIRVGDRIGVLVNVPARWVNVYKNYEPVQHLKFQHFFSKPVTARDSFFPVVGMANEMQLEITHLPSLAKYTDINFSADSLNQTEYKHMSLSPKSNGPVVIGTIVELLDALNIVNHQSVLLEQNLDALTKEFLNTLNLPTPLEHKLWHFRNLLLSNFGISAESVCKPTIPLSSRRTVEIEIADE